MALKEKVNPSVMQFAEGCVLAINQDMERNTPDVADAVHILLSSTRETFLSYYKGSHRFIY